MGTRVIDIKNLPDDLKGWSEEEINAVLDKLESKSIEELLEMGKQLYKMEQAVKPWWEYSLEYIEKGFIPCGAGLMKNDYV